MTVKKESEDIAKVEDSSEFSDKTPSSGITKPFATIVAANTWIKDTLVFILGSTLGLVSYPLYLSFVFWLIEPPKSIFWGFILIFLSTIVGAMLVGLLFEIPSIFRNENKSNKK